MRFVRRALALFLAGTLCGCAWLAYGEIMAADGINPESTADADLIEQIMACEWLGGVPTGRVAIVEHDDKVTCATPRRVEQQDVQTQPWQDGPRRRSAK